MGLLEVLKAAVFLIFILFTVLSCVFTMFGSISDVA